MAQAFTNMYGQGLVAGYSAGSRPSGRINPKAIAAMQELGYNLAAHTSKGLYDVVHEAPFEVVVTMGCGDACPWMPARRHIDWSIPDPREMDAEEFNIVRDEIKSRVQQLVKDVLA